MNKEWSFIRVHNRIISFSDFLKNMKYDYLPPPISYIQSLKRSLNEYFLENSLHDVLQYFLDSTHPKFYN